MRGLMARGREGRKKKRRSCCRGTPLSLFPLFILFTPILSISSTSPPDIDYSTPPLGPTTRGRRPSEANEAGETSSQTPSCFPRTPGWRPQGTRRTRAVRASSLGFAARASRGRVLDSPPFGRCDKGPKGSPHKPSPPPRPPPAHNNNNNDSLLHRRLSHLRVQGASCVAPARKRAAEERPSHRLCARARPHANNDRRSRSQPPWPFFPPLPPPKPPPPPKNTNHKTGQALPARPPPRLDPLPLRPPGREGAPPRSALLPLRRGRLPRLPPAGRPLPARRRVPLCARRL